MWLLGSASPQCYCSVNVLRTASSSDNELLHGIDIFLIEANCITFPWLVFYSFLFFFIEIVVEYDIFGSKE